MLQRNFSTSKTDMMDYSRGIVFEAFERIELIVDERIAHCFPI
jgi:hypothetical protein